LTGQASISGGDTESNAIGKVGHDREWVAESVIGDAYSDREERRRGGRSGAVVRKIDKPQPTFPRVERGYANTFTGAELCDRQSAVYMTTDALAPEGVALKVGCSRHGLSS
jgi:hypothetical protein